MGEGGAAGGRRGVGISPGLLLTQERREWPRFPRRLAEDRFAARSFHRESIAKAFTNEAALEVANGALQVFGAAGYSTDLPMEYILRRVRGWMIAGGPVEILRNRVAEAVLDRRFSQRPPLNR